MHMKTYIWALPTRIFHWLLAIGFAAAYLLGDAESQRNLHYAFGAFVGTLIFFRLIYGFFGPTYSNFKDFPIGIKNQMEFFRTYFAKTKSYPGHNPLASIVMLCIFLIGLFTGISGYLMYASENGAMTLSINEELLEEGHEIMANLFLILVGLHLLGTLGDFIFHRKTGTLLSIFTGYKNIEAKNTQLSGFHKAFIVLWFVIPFYVFYLAYGLPASSNEMESGDENKEHYDDHDGDDDD
jgi:cytochrome b